jgi:hypothetical protein
MAAAIWFWLIWVLSSTRWRLVLAYSGFTPFRAVPLCLHFDRPLRLGVFGSPIR